MIFVRANTGTRYSYAQYRLIGKCTIKITYPKVIVDYIIVEGKYKLAD